MKRVVIESPFAGTHPVKVVKELERARNRAYLVACLADCFARGEAPFASHGLYALDGVLDDDDPKQRKLGMLAGFEWGGQAQLCAVYADLGQSEGMREGIERANRRGQTVERRELGARWFGSEIARHFTIGIANEIARSGTLS